MLCSRTALGRYFVICSQLQFLMKMKLSFLPCLIDIIPAKSRGSFDFLHPCTLVAEAQPVSPPASRALGGWYRPLQAWGTSSGGPLCERRHPLRVVMQLCCLFLRKYNWIPSVINATATVLSLLIYFLYKICVISNKCWLMLQLLPSVLVNNIQFQYWLLSCVLEFRNMKLKI